MAAQEAGGARYKVLATRCRASAIVCQDDAAKAALLRMAGAYDRRAVEVEREWNLREATGCVSFDDRTR